MKKTIKLVTVCALIACSGAYAATSSNSSSSAEQNTTATGTATNAGNSQNITFTSPPSTTAAVSENITGTQVVKNTPSVDGPNLVSSNDTCMGSASGSANVPGFGISVGKTYTDSNCVMLKNAREFWNMGMKAAALALMCNDAANKEALELTGFVCPQTKRDQALRAQAAAANEPTDPIVRKRMGLPELASVK
jgi:hypothetical protein